MLQFIADNVEDFDVICLLADDFYEKGIFFHILVGFHPSKSFRDSSLLLLTTCKRQFSVDGQIFFNRADKNKNTVIMLYYMSDIKVPDNSHE